MRTLVVAVAVMLTAQISVADEKIDGRSVAQAKERYDQLYLACRGGSGDDPRTQAACVQRDELGRAIKGYGWCYVGGWKACAPTVAKQPAINQRVASSNWRDKQIQVGAKQDCFLISGTVSIVPVWRDNNVPISKVHANIDSILIQTGASDSEKKEWHQLVGAIYSSRATSSEIEQQLRPPCVRMTDDR